MVLLWKKCLLSGWATCASSRVWPETRHNLPVYPSDSCVRQLQSNPGSKQPFPEYGSRQQKKRTAIKVLIVRFFCFGITYQRARPLLRGLKGAPFSGEDG